MSARVSALPLEVDPLIAGAKERARRRRTGAAVLLGAAAVAAGGMWLVLRSPGPAGSPGGPSRGAAAQNGSQAAREREREAHQLALAELRARQQERAAQAAAVVAHLRQEARAAALRAAAAEKK
jgi:hypothetical protein